MEVRIGVVHTPKELALEVEASLDEVKKLIEKALSDDDGVLWLTDSRGRIVGVPSERVAYVEIETPTARPSGWGSAAADRGTLRAVGRPRAGAGRCSTGACSSSPARAASARARSRRRSRSSPPSRASASSSSRSTPRATSPTCSSTSRSGSSRRSVYPGVHAMQLSTEASLREYLRLNLKIPMVGRIGPLANVVRLRGQRRAGREGDPHRRQGVLGGPRVDRGAGRLGPRGRRRRRHRSRARAARRAAHDPRARAHRPDPQPDRVDARDPLRPARSPR